jgi:hypothetical protein
MIIGNDLSHFFFYFFRNKCFFRGHSKNSHLVWIWVTLEQHLSVKIIVRNNFYGNLTWSIINCFYFHFQNSNSWRSASLLRHARRSLRFCRHLSQKEQSRWWFVLRTVPGRQFTPGNGTKPPQTCHHHIWVSMHFASTCSI